MSSENAVESPTESGGLTFLEQLTAQSAQLCPNPKVPLLVGVNHSDKKSIFIRGRCGMWSCPVCGASKAKQWVARVLNHINSRKKKTWFFLTVTAHDSWRGRDASVKNIRANWGKLRKRMARRLGKNFEYVKVWEFHEDGSFHLHLLVNKKIGKKWLKDNSAECGMGYMCDSSRAKNPGQVVGYIAKYMVKSFAVADKYPKGMRRIECSRNWDKLPDLSDGELDGYVWDTYQTYEGMDNKRKYLRENGYKIVDLRPSSKAHNRALGYDDQG